MLIIGLATLLSFFLGTFPGLGAISPQSSFAQSADASFAPSSPKADVVTDGRFLFRSGLERAQKERSPGLFKRLFGTYLVALVGAISTFDKACRS